MTTTEIKTTDKGQTTPVVESEVIAADRAMGAAMIASGIGATVLGLAIILSEMSPAIKTALTWVKPVGPLSGKTGVSVIAFVVSWIALHFAFKSGKGITLTTAFIVTLILLVIGLLLTFPPVFLQFGE